MNSHTNSYYAATANPLDAFDALEGDRRCDVCIVGGGFTGLSAALHLADAGVDVCLIEANRVGWGASGRNGGQIGSGQRLWQTDLEQRVGMADAKKLWGIAEDAKALVLGLIDSHDIACDLAHGILNPVHKRAYEAEYRDYADHLCDVYGYDDAVMLDAVEMAEKLKAKGYYGGILDKGAAHFHPLNFARGLADAARKAGAAIFEGTRAIRIATGGSPSVETGRGAIAADQIIVACNGYLDGLFPAVETKLFPINNFIIATEPLTPDEEQALIADRLAVADSRFVVYYYRFSGDHRLIFGGGETYSRRFPPDIAGFVRPHLKRIFPQLADIGIDYAWGGTLAITLNRLPLFDRPAPGVLIAAGYSGHGVALATLGGQLLAEAVQGPSLRFDQMARLPTPGFPGGKALQRPGLIAAMLWYKLRDSL